MSIESDSDGVMWPPVSLHLHDEQPCSGPTAFQPIQSSVNINFLLLILQYPFIYMYAIYIIYENLYSNLLYWTKCRCTADLHHP
jgi:hypothetical protein